MISDLSNHIFVWRELKELNNTLSGKKIKTCGSFTSENCPGTTTNGVSAMRKRPSDNSYVKRIGLTGSSESNAWRNEDMKQGLYRANGDLYEEEPKGNCNYNSNNTLQDLNYLNTQACIFDDLTSLKVKDYDNNWKNLKGIIKKIRVIDENKKTFVFSGHQHNLQNMFFSFKKPESSNLKYGFANCACIEVTFDTSMNILDVNVIYQGMDTEKGIMLDNNNTISGNPSGKYGYVNGNIVNILDSLPQIERSRSENATNEDEKIAEVAMSQQPVDDTIKAIFIRHGQAFHNKPHEISKNDSLLTPEGIMGSLQINIGRKLPLQECAFLTSPLIRCIMTLCGFIKSSVNYTGHDQFKVNIDRIFSKIITISKNRMENDYKKNGLIEKYEDLKSQGEIAEQTEKVLPISNQIGRTRSNAVIPVKRDFAQIGGKKKTKRRKRNKTKKHKGKKQKRSKRRNKKTHK